MAEPYQVPSGIRLFRAVMRPLFRDLFHILAHVRITGRENVPRGRGLFDRHEPRFVV